MKQNLREGAKEQRERKRLYIKIYNLYGTLLVNSEKQNKVYNGPQDILFNEN